ncbi:MAG TPA: alkaline phosphatase family protein [Thermoanaerobaculia bacterium]
MAGVVAQRSKDAKRFVDRHREGGETRRTGIMSDTPRHLHTFLIGAAVGLGAGDLLLGLNPALLGLVRTARLLGGLGVLGLLVFGLATIWSREKVPGRGGWLVSGVGAGAFGLFVESQRELNYLFIGNGMRRLLVAASAVSFVLAAVCLAAIFLRPGLRAARTVAAAAVLLYGIVPFVGRRAPERERLAASSVLPRASSRGLLVIGIEGASWELLTAGASDGSLPAVARLLKEGVAGPLGTLVPYGRDSTWISAATGKRPSKHGVVSGRRFDTPLGSLTLLPRFRHGEPLRALPFSTTVPLDGEARRSLTFWEILAARGHEGAVLSWPAAAARDGLVLWASERMFATPGEAVDGRPKETAAGAARFRVGVAGLDPVLVASLEPRGLPSEDRARAGALPGAARDLSVVGAALAALPAGPGSVSALVLTGMAEPARIYGPSATPSGYWGATGRTADLRARALLGYYRLVDRLIGELREREGKDRTICLFAPVGYGPLPVRDALVQFAMGREPEAAPDPRHSGFVILTGSGIRAGARLTSANLFDLAPTLLALAGEPVARDFDGRVLAEAFDERFAESTSIPIIVSFEPGGPQ